MVPASYIMYACLSRRLKGQHPLENGRYELGVSETSSW